MLGSLVGSLVAEGIERVTAPLRVKIAQLEADLAIRPTAEALADIVARNAIAAAAAVPRPVDGKSVTVDDVRPMLEQMFAALPKVKDGNDGTSVTIEDLRPMLVEMVAAIPTPKDGADGRDFDPDAMRAEVARQIALVPPPQDGRSIDLGAIFTEIGVAVSRAVEALPKAKDGAPGEPGADGKEGAPGKDGRAGVDGKDGSPGVDGKDGVPGERGTDGINGKDGCDGVAGKDGRDGVDGRSVDVEEIRGIVGELLASAVDAIPKAKDGEPGRDGRDGQPGIPGAAGENGADGVNGRDGTDGLSLDDLEVEMKGRTLAFRLKGGDREVFREFRLPILKDAGVYDSGKGYEEGDCVSYGGSLFIAQRDTNDAPGGKSGDWRLAVKRGKDGKGAA